MHHSERQLWTQAGKTSKKKKELHPGCLLMDEACSAFGAEALGEDVGGRRVGAFWGGNAAGSPLGMWLQAQKLAAGGAVKSVLTIRENLLIQLTATEDLQVPTRGIQ